MLTWHTFSTAGFAGSRHLSPPLVRVLAASAQLAGVPVFTTCAAGVCSLARPFAARVWSAGQPPFAPLPFRQSLAARASAFVRALAASPAPVLLVWPSAPALATFAPARRWQSVTVTGSGSWSEVAQALGLGVPVVLFGQPAPAGVAVASSPFYGSVLLQPVPRFF